MNLTKREMFEMFKIKMNKSISTDKVLSLYAEFIEDYKSEGHKIIVDVEKRIPASASPPPQQKQPVQQSSTDASPEKQTKGLSQEGVYMGKTAVTQGEKNGKQWQLFNVAIQMENDKTWNFSAFNSAKGLTELKEFDKVKVIYNTKEKTNKDNQQYTAKNAYCFVKRSEKNEETVTEDDSLYEIE